MRLLLGIFLIAGLIAFGIGPSPFAQSYVGYNTTTFALVGALIVAFMIAVFVALAIAAGKAFYAGDQRGSWRERQGLGSMMSSFFFSMIAAGTDRLRDMFLRIMPVRPNLGTA